MSLNDTQDAELTFSQRENGQVYLSTHKSIRPTFLKNHGKGIQSFIFNRNYLALNIKAKEFCNKILRIRKMKRHAL